ncbi:MAG: epoxyqueuosine reductase QueH [Candidatus Omnitrophota bacterium]
MEDKPRLLLHICCAPCGAYPIKLLRDKFEVEAFFYNSNVHPREEYETRLEEARRYASETGVKFHEGDYDEQIWLRQVSGLENELEGGRRCEICYRVRLGKTARFAAANGFDYFATALSISPHKDVDTINSVGNLVSEMYSVSFYAADFKENDGFKISAQLSREANLYRQDYCGCLYSKKKGKDNKNV